MVASNKHLKEEFVSGLTGGSVSEIYLITFMLPVSIHRTKVDR